MTVGGVSGFAYNQWCCIGRLPYDPSCTVPGNCCAYPVGMCINGQKVLSQGVADYSPGGAVDPNGSYTVTCGEVIECTYQCDGSCTPSSCN